MSLSRISREVAGNKALQEMMKDRQFAFAVKHANPFVEFVENFQENHENLIGEYIKRNAPQKAAIELEALSKGFFKEYSEAVKEYVLESLDICYKYGMITRDELEKFSKEIEAFMVSKDDDYAKVVDLLWKEQMEGNIKDLTSRVNNIQTEIQTGHTQIKNELKQHVTNAVNKVDGKFEKNLSSLAHQISTFITSLSSIAKADTKPQEEQPEKELTPREILAQMSAGVGTEAETAASKEGNTK
jgi:hypothetical protein